MGKAIQQTFIPELDVLSNGPILPNLSELLNSKTMLLVMEEAKGEYDHLLYDTPPVLAVSDAQIYSITVME
ncbi:hypothetical protein WD019_18620 [Fictibacillus sp. Mic-4]|uniref:hypothetical protein n=1 Tax=Fictibacillus sp. Mic-4 TaxID=3132826 RepID=UPI003CEC9C6F